MNYARIEHGPMAAVEIGAHFTQVYNGLIRDTRLTGTAKAVFLVIASHKIGYGISVESISKYMKEGRDAINAALRLLEKYSYLVRVQQRNEHGKLGQSVYRITDMPSGLKLIVEPPFADLESPRSEPMPENPSTGVTCENAPSDDDSSLPTSEPFTEKPSTAEPFTADPETKKTNTHNTNHQEHVPEVLRTSGRGHARTREAEPRNDEAPAVPPSPPKGVANHDRKATGLSVVPEAPDPDEAERLLTARANRVAQAWWDSLDVKPMGRARVKADGSVSGSPADRKRKTFFALRGSVAAALEQGWTEEQVAYVLKNRAKTLPSVQVLEIWLREEHEAAEARRRGQAPPPRGRPGGQQGWTPHRADLPEEERDQFRAMFGETPRREAQ